MPSTAVQSYTPQPLHVTDRAAEKVRALVREEGVPTLALRVFVTGGGCSGFKYGFSFDESIADDDTVIEYSDIKIVVDALSLPYLEGAEVDYRVGLDGSRFTVTNPNATSTCGCGSSFSM
jgi:iron-sulfur cluster insertion protein